MAQQVIYSYDSLDRLTQATYSDGSVVAYSYDPAGNRLTQSVSKINLVAPHFTSASNTTFTAGQQGIFLVTATGTPSPSFSASNMPSWLNLDPNTGVLSGTPPSSVGSPLTINLIAFNAASPNATQAFTLTVQGPPVGGIGSWVAPTSPTTNTLNAITSANGLLVAVGENGTILTSRDGVTWTTANSGSTSSLRGICYGNGIFVAAGGDGTVLTSPDGVNWTPHGDYQGFGIYTISFGNGLFVAAGYGGIIQTSTDGANWTYQESVGANLYASTFGNGVFVLAGYLNPANGVTWGISVVTDGGANLNQGFVGSTSNPIIFKSLTYGNGLFVGVGDNGQVGSSPDGITWTIHASNTTQNLTAVAYFGQFIAVGQGGVMITSADGVTWTPVTSPTTTALNAVYPANGTFFAAGSNGVIEESGLLQMTYSQWLSTHFLSSQLTNPAITGPGATPQNDGIVNQLKYIFDIDPSATMKASDRAALPAVGMVTSAGNEYLTLTYRENPTYSGVTVNLQYSADLKTWQTTVPAFDVIVGTDPSTGDPLIEQGVNVTGTSRGFLRLNVTSP